MKHNLRGKDGRFSAKAYITIKARKRVATKKAEKNKDLRSHDLFILDRSGSMGTVRRETIDGFNKVVAEIVSVAKDKGIDSRCSLIQFDYPGDIDTMYMGLKSSEVPALSTENFKPRGNTALYDAIGKGITDLRKNLTNEGKGMSVTVYIFTDGQENASIEYRTSDSVKRLIDSVRDDLGWTITFIGAGEDYVVKSVASSMGIFSSNTLAYRSGSVGTTTAFNTMSKSRGAAMNSYASTGDTKNIGFFSDEDDNN